VPASEHHREAIGSDPVERLLVLVLWKELSKATDTRQQAKYLLDFFQGATLRSKLERSGEPIDTFLSVVFSNILVKR
jgi:hypothetical protein